jgi:hypothetical protein
MQEDKTATALRVLNAILRDKSPIEEDISALQSWVNPDDRDLPAYDIARIVMNMELSQHLRTF